MKTLAILLLLPLYSLAQHHCGVLWQPIDGDSFLIQLTDTTGIIHVRLHAVDCPERKQAFGPEATAYTKAALEGKSFCIDIMDWDAHNYAFCLVTVGGRSLNADILSAGLGWYQNQHYGSEIFNRAEETAKRLKKGLWSAPNPTPPWKFRQQSKAKTARSKPRNFTKTATSKTFDTVALTRSRPQKHKR